MALTESDAPELDRESFAMRDVQRIRNLSSRPERLRERDQALQRLAFDMLHHPIFLANQPGLTASPKAI